MSLFLFFTPAPSFPLVLPRLDIHRAGVADIESGVRKARHLELIVLAEVLNTTVYGLLGGEQS